MARVNSIEWGALSPGQNKKMTVYVRNEGNEAILLNVVAANFKPTNSSTYISFTWSCSDKKVDANQTIQVTQNLQISPKIKGIYNFSFDIILKGEAYILGDINKDGRVDFWDAMLFSSTYGSNPQDSRWNPNADLNIDGTINIFDAIILSALFQ